MELRHRVSERMGQESATEGRKRGKVIVVRKAALVRKCEVDLKGCLCVDGWPLDFGCSAREPDGLRQLARLGSFVSNLYVGKHRRAATCYHCCSYFVLSDDVDIPAPATCLMPS